jgi:hypothetical protein
VGTNEAICAQSRDIAGARAQSKNQSLSVIRLSALLWKLIICKKQPELLVKSRIRLAAMRRYSLFALAATEAAAANVTCAGKSSRPAVSWN